jgi:hypothetical protein
MLDEAFEEELFFHSDRVTCNLNILCSKLVFDGKQLRSKDNKRTNRFHKQVVNFCPVRGWDGTLRD